jgi:hypothetical protein
MKGVRAASEEENWLLIYFERRDTNKYLSFNNIMN